MRSRILASALFSLTLAVAAPALKAQVEPAPPVLVEPAPAPAPEPAPAPAPPPLPAPEVVAYYVALNGQQAGPFDLARLTQMIASGELTRATLVWKAGMPDWASAEGTAELKPLFAAAPPVVPFDCAGVIIGVWERVEMIAGIEITTQTRFEANGKFTGVQSMTGVPGVGFFGDWTAKAAGDKVCNYTLNGTFDNGSPGGTSSALFDIIDRDNMTQKGSTAVIRRLQ